MPKASPATTNVIVGPARVIANACPGVRYPLATAKPPKPCSMIESPPSLKRLAMSAWPRQVWRFGRGWRFSNPEEVHLSADYVTWLRLSGAVGVLLGIIVIGYAFK